jgi:hypothetical protein
LCIESAGEPVIRYQTYVLKLSIDGTPCRPLYLRESLVPVPWRVVENSPIIHRD